MCWCQSVLFTTDTAIVFTMSIARSSSTNVRDGTLGPAHNEHFDAKKIAHCKQVLIVTELVVAGILLIVHCSSQSAILSNGRYVKVMP